MELINLQNDKKKPANALTVDELLESLNNQEQSEQVLEYHNDVLPFLTHFSIISGAYPVLNSLIYKLYKAWSKNPVSQNVFSLTANQILFHIKRGSKSYYLINKPAIKIAESEFELVRGKKRKLDKSPLYRKHFENFINKHNLLKEEIYVESYVLYYIYDKWCYSINRKIPLGYDSFVMFCGLYFKNKRITNSNMKWFLVSKELYQYVTEEELKEVKEGWKTNHFYKAKSKKESKKRRKVPRFKPKVQSKA